MPARRFAVVLLFLVTFPLFAQTPPFEAVVAGVRFQCSEFQPPTAYGLAWINPDRLDVTTDASTAIVDIGSADGRTVLALQRQPNAFRVVEVRPDGSMTPISATIPGFTPIEIDVAGNGRIFVLAFPNVPDGTSRLFVFSSAGIPEATHVLAGSGPTALTVASDGCTILFIRDFVVRRFNACTGTPLPDFAPRAEYTDIDTLPDGRVVLATSQSVLLYDANGTLIRTIVADATAAYGLSEHDYISDIAVASDQQTLSIALGSRARCPSAVDVLRVSFANGARLSTRTLPINGVYDLILGAAAAPAPGAANVPTASEWMLMLLAIALGAVGAWYART